MLYFLACHFYQKYAVSKFFSMKFPIEWAVCELSKAILKFSMGKIFIGWEFWMNVKKNFRE